MALTDYVLMPGADYLALCNAIRAKTGKSELIKSGELAAEIERITSGGEAQVTEFLASTTATNQLLGDLGVFGFSAAVDQHTYEAWSANVKPVKVVYDGEEYTCSPQVVIGEKAVGNFTDLYGTGNGEPFAILGAWDQVGDDVVYYFLIGSRVDTEPTEHTVRIYQEASASMEGVHTVTFMTEDGSSVLYERLVVDGDDCANVVDRGLLAAPTKDSTVQYDYTYSGWSLTSGGSANASALSSVTSDRTVYAAFTSAVREYTITYLDSDGSVLKTESLAYGSMPNYEATKDDYDFVAWTPAPVAVTGDASYIATWQMKAAFATATWNEIASICKAGNAASMFALGDTRSLTLKDGRELILEIIGFNHDTLSDGSGKAALSIVVKDGNVEKYYLSFSQGDNWTTNNLRKKVLTYLDKLPDDLKSLIKNVSKRTQLGASQATVAYATESIESVWLLSETEVLGEASNRTDGPQYGYFNTAENRKRYCNGTAQPYFLRSNKNGWNDYAGAIDESGKLYVKAGSYSAYLVFGFCI